MEDMLMTRLLAFDPLTVTGRPGAYVAAGYAQGKPYSADGQTFEEACLALLAQVEQKKAATCRCGTATRDTEWCVTCSINRSVYRKMNGLGPNDPLPGDDEPKAVQS